MGDVDRKRSHGEPEQYPSKRPLQELSSSGPLTQADVVYFKKEAIWRQMKHYKSRAQRLGAQVHDYEQKVQSFVAVCSLLESWYSYIVELAQKSTPQPLSLGDTPEAIAQIVEERRGVLRQVMHEVAARAGAGAEADGARAARCVELEADLQQAKRRSAELQSAVDALEARVQNMQSDADRAESASLKRVLLNSHVAEPEPEVKEEPAAPVGGGPGEQPDTSAQEHELQSLRVELDTLNAGYTAMAESLAEKDRGLQAAVAENHGLQARLADLTEPDLMKSKFYLSFLEKHKALVDKAAHHSKVHEQMVSKLEELEAREGNVVALLSKDMADENGRLKELLSKAESDLVRVRTARDELIGKHTILKQDLESRKDNAELLKMNDVLHERLKRYEDESTQKGTAEDEAALSHLEKPDLIRRFVVLNSELKDIEKAFQETRELSIGKEKDHVDKESVIKKLSIEKAKADQKYFASMRLKDSLVSENKVLKSQVAKSQELVTKSADLEKAYLGKIELLTKSVDDYKAIKQSSIHEATSLHQTINSLTKSREVVSGELKAVKKQHAELKADADAKTDKLAGLKVAHAKLEAKLRSTESLLAKYKSNNTSSILQEDEKQLEALRSITKCSVCSKNWKNMAITACGHVFCDSCVQERLNARLRRCPTCNKGFSANDLLQIHL